MYRTSAYDAGTELNTEAQGSIPGPADGGEGFNVERNDNQNMVTMHSGVVGNDDGLTSSTLTSIHKFDNPLLAITIERIK
ncbi:spondin domain-containing protein [Pseudoalteromonas sp. PS5]|nr:spondin domain-containing protein [Pseudoalteromonas sp. PS5]